MKRTIAISLKIPDNTAYTALVALRRLDVAVARVERSEIWLFDDDGDLSALTDRILTDETIFNPNLHRLAVLDSAVPRPGEVWIEPLEQCHPERSRRAALPAATAWRLFDANGLPVEGAVLSAAIERLLRNPAVDCALTHGSSAIDGDISCASE
jgi:hypothetical protein